MGIESPAETNKKTEVLIEPQPLIANGRVVAYTLTSKITLNKKEHYAKIKAPAGSAMIFAVYSEDASPEGSKCKDDGPFKSVGVYLDAGDHCIHDPIHGREGQQFGCLAYLVKEGLIAEAEIATPEEGPAGKPPSPRPRSIDRPKIHIAGG